VNFISLPGELARLEESLSVLGADFERMSTSQNALSGSVIISGKITPEYAAIIRLSDSFLSERMNISYISGELKNKYRKTISS
jgi:hypothetical protein